MCVCVVCVWCGGLHAGSLCQRGVSHAGGGLEGGVKGMRTEEGEEVG